MTKKHGTKNNRPHQEKSEPDALEKEIEDMIEREKTKQNIVSKLLGKPNSKTKKSDN